jgi:hypothetical protein
MTLSLKERKDIPATELSSLYKSSNPPWAFNDLYILFYTLFIIIII